MRLAGMVAAGLLLWSLVGNLVFWEVAYVSRNLVLAGLLLWVAHRSGRTRGDLGLTGTHLGSGLAWGAGAVLLVAGVLVGAVLLQDHIPGVALLLQDERAAAYSEQLYWNLFVRIPVGTALFEEVAFRGVLLALLLAHTTPSRAVWLSSATFGLWHIAPTVVALQFNDLPVADPVAWATLAGAVAVTTIAGAIFCWLRLRSQSLVAPFLAHCATNIGGLLAATAAS